MAEEALRKLEEQLQCVVCLGTYIDPKQLQCHHTYCKECLMGLTKTDEQGKVSVTCPNCRQVTPVTDSGVGGLQPAFQINNLLEIQESFKKAETVGLTRKDSEAETIPEGEELEPSQKGVRDTNAYCSEHVDEELKIYCNTCELVICLKYNSTSLVGSHSIERRNRLQQSSNPEICSGRNFHRHSGFLMDWWDTGFHDVSQSQGNHIQQH